MRHTRAIVAVTALLFAAAGPVGLAAAAPLHASTAVPSPQTASSSTDVIDLGNLGSGASEATAINNQGQVVGDSFGRGFSWTAAGGMVDLGNPFGTQPSSTAATGVNDAGVIVGNSTSVPPYSATYAFTWTPATGMVIFPGLHFGDTPAAVAINGQGQIAGDSTTPTGTEHAVFWTSGHVSVDLGVLGGVTGGSSAVALNDNGQVVGTSSTALSYDAFSWTQAGGMVDLGNLGGGSSQAMAVNNAGQVIGFSYNSHAQSHAFSWTAGSGIVDLGTLGGTQSQPFAINSYGEVVGDSTTAGGAGDAFSWTQAGGMVDLGNLGGAGGAVAMAVNNSGEVIGRSQNANGDWDAFSWTAATGMVDLGALPGDWAYPVAINDAGQIVGYSYPAHTLGPDEATLWQPQNLGSGNGNGSGGGGGSGGASGSSGPAVGVVSAGGSTSSDPVGTTPTASNPLVITVTSPLAGTVTIDKTPPNTAVMGYRQLGLGATISAPVTSPSAPLRLSFEVFDGDLPPGTYSSDLTAFRNGVPIHVCYGTPGTAMPDPCVVSSTTTAGVTTIVVLSTHASTWNVEAADIGRIAGPDRITTAVAVSEDSYPAGGAGAVVLATATNYPDALVGAPLAAAKNAPLLLTQGATLPAATFAEIKRLLPAGGTVYLLGGTAVVPATIATELSTAGYQVIRYSGATRYATAVAVAGALGNPSTVLLASGTNFPDALAAGPAAAHVHGVVLLTDSTTTPAATAAYLSSSAHTVYAIGGPAAAADPKATPLAGSDRYATAAAVAVQFFPSPTFVGIATGLAFPDALSGGAQLGHLGGPLLLTATDNVPSATSTYRASTRASVVSTHVYGGTSAIDDSVMNQLQQG
jgi:probable HAF family extracellular repeat protein